MLVVIADDREHPLAIPRLTRWRGLAGHQLRHGPGVARDDDLLARRQLVDQFRQARLRLFQRHDRHDALPRSAPRSFYPAARENAPGKTPVRLLSWRCRPARATSGVFAPLVGATVFKTAG